MPPGSVGPSVRYRTGATYRIAPGDADTATWEYAPLEHDQTFQIGDMDVIVRSVATPGHTPGSTSLEVDGRFLMTGDAVFVSGVGRPDLGGQTEPWARDLFATIHDQLAALDELQRELDDSQQALEEWEQKARELRLTSSRL